jgi:hypothetical protein
LPAFASIKETPAGEQGVVKSILAGRAAISTPAIVAVVVAIVSAAQAARVAGAATAAGPHIVGLRVGAAYGLIGQSGSGQSRYRDSGEEGISQKCSHLKSP